MVQIKECLSNFSFPPTRSDGQMQSNQLQADNFPVSMNAINI
jgi:hypothetical protein